MTIARVSKTKIKIMKTKIRKIKISIESIGCFIKKKITFVFQYSELSVLL